MTVAAHCVPLPAIVKGLSPGAGAVQVFTPEQAKVLVAYVARVTNRELPAFDTIAVLFTTDNRALVFLGNKGSVCSVIRATADQARAVIKGALGEPL